MQTLFCLEYERPFDCNTNALKRVMLCSALPCYAMLSYAMQRFAMICCAMLRYAMERYAML